MLTQLNTISDVLVAQRRPDRRPDEVSKFTGALAEAIASGPYFKVMLVNLLPYQIIQPWVDAAFKKRGIDPNEFWRNAGLPEFRYPDPNGERFPNGAPPQAPMPLEGTPEHPGPAVPPGSGCRWDPGTGTRAEAGVTPELVGVDATLLERCVDPRLGMIWNGNRFTNMTLKYGPDAMASASDAVNLANESGVVDQVVLPLDEHVADRVELRQHLVEVRVVVDEALDLSGRRRRTALERVG